MKNTSTTPPESAATAENSPNANDPRSLLPYLDAQVFRALGDETRLAVLARLAVTPGSQTVTDIASCCGVHLSGVSRHLRQLHDAGLVSAEKSGREVRYRLRCNELATMLRDLADAVERCAAVCATMDDPATCCGPEQEKKA